MKYLAQMNRVVRISTIAVILCIAITAGSLVYKHSTAHACGNSIVSASTTSVHYPSAITGDIVSIIFSLWYNSCNQQNFTSANIVSGSVDGLLVLVNRNAGPDGGRTGAGSNRCPSTGICNSPGVYSPHNTAYSTIIIPENAYNITTASF